MTPPIEEMILSHDEQIRELRNHIETLNREMGVVCNDVGWVKSAVKWIIGLVVVNLLGLGMFMAQQFIAGHLKF